MDVDKVCPQCGERYKWYEAECPVCHVRLVDLPEDERPEPDVRLTQVFRSQEPGLVALAGLSLGQQKIEYFVRGAAGDPLLAGGRALRGQTAFGPFEILVRDEDADNAREILHDLALAPRSVETTAAAGAAAPADGSATTPGTIDMVDLETNQSVGRISEADLDFLGEHLEKESADDQDYYFDQATLDMLESRGATPGLLAVLRGALRGREGVELRWSPRH
ncbi:MAG TPA: DUF2007 domain-containing protein [Vicinamibacterales bacterium]|nr:DUF2007 domain-containing protein [Vicinamibacterales bacterium]